MLKDKEIRALKKAQYFGIDKWGTGPACLCPVAMVARMRGEPFRYEDETAIPVEGNIVLKALKDVSSYLGYESDQDFLDDLELKGRTILR